MTSSQPSTPAPTLAIATIPMQPWVTPFEFSKALKVGTMFPNLYYPFYIGGEQNDK